MYYTAQQGVRETWRDHVQTIINEFRERNWLPAAVAIVMVSWVSLIVMGLQQTVLTPPQVPDTTQVGDSGQTLDVTTVAVVSSTRPDNDSFSSSTSSAPATMAEPAQAEGQTATVADEASETIGGPGDEVLPELGTNPVGETGGDLPIVTPILEPVVEVGGEILDPVLNIVDDILPLEALGQQLP